MSAMPATLLIVDNDVHVRKLLEVLLRGQGYQTLTAGSGKEALAMVMQHAPDLILLDIQMPDMDGYEATRRLHDWELARRAASSDAVLLPAHRG